MIFVPGLDLPVPELTGPLECDLAFYWLVVCLLLNAGLRWLAARPGS